MRIFLIVIFLFSTSLEKKAHKTLYKYYGEEVYLERTKTLNTGIFYEILNKKDFVFIGYSPSKFENFDFMVLFDENKKIKLVKVLKYREHYGGEIGSTRWLKQFIGMDKPKYFVDAISGATISVNSLKYSLNNLVKGL